MRQLEQLVAATDGEYEPDEQLEQIVDEESEYKPTEQAPVTAVRPVEAQYEPAGQAEHAVDPVEA